MTVSHYSNFLSLRPDQLRSIIMVRPFVNAVCMCTLSTYGYKNLKKTFLQADKWIYFSRCESLFPQRRKHNDCLRIIPSYVGSSDLKPESPWKSFFYFQKLWRRKSASFFPENNSCDS